MRSESYGSAGRGRAACHVEDPGALRSDRSGRDPRLPSALALASGGQERLAAAAGALCLALFAWLLSAAGRVYAAYGGVYICVALLWLWLVDGIRPTVWDLFGGGVALAGMAIIVLAPRSP